MTKQRLVLSVAVAILSVFFCPLVSHAAILTFVMEGTVSTVGSDPPGLPNYAEVGDRARYTFTFDTDAPNRYPPSASAGLYDGISSSLQVGSKLFTCSAPTILISHSLFNLDFSVSPPDAAIEGGSGYFRLDDQGENDAIPDYSLPLAPYDLAQFRFSGFAINLSAPPLPGRTYDTIFYFGGDMIDVFNAIPEPASVLLTLCVGLGALLFQRRAG